MLPDQSIHDELHGISPTIAGMPKVNVFTVPEGYFDSLTTNILLNINNLEKKDLAVPEGYFESLPGLILDRIRREEESSVLAGISRNNVFSVPDGYFDQLPDQVVSQLPRQAKVVGFNRTSSFFRYALAACLTGILGLSLFSVLNNANDPIETSSPVVVAEASKILQENAFDQVMNSVTDEEITQYLQSNGQDVNTALMASLSDETELPDADEYIYDDQTLDRLMKDLHISQTAQN